MRVLLTTPYDLAVAGGVNRHALDLLDALTARGLDARLVGPASAPVHADDPRITRFGRVSVRGLNGARSRVTLDLGIGPAMRRLIREFQPDVIHLQEPFLPTLNTFALLQAGRSRRVGTFHTFSETSRGYLWAWPWCRWINRRLDARIAVSPAARDFATRYHPAAFQVIPNGVRLPPIHAGRPPRRLGSPVRILFVGRADEPRKGFAVLRAAFSRLEAEQPGAFLLDAVGPATARGEVSAAELSAAYAAADVCVVPSLGGESFGLVALEALAHGVPVIATRIRGYAEWLGGSEAAELVPPGDAPALAAAIRALGANPERHARAARAASAHAARYDWIVLAGEIVTTIYSPLA
jgi:phosphatidyl-myo-inositol alpha-mannosyltransferase